MTQLDVLFLDIDGVFNSVLFFKRPSYTEEGATTAEERAIIRRVLPHVDLPPGAKNRMSIRLDIRQLDSRAIRWLNRVTRQPNVGVVVSSTWRHGYKEKGLQLLLESRGFEGKVIGRTLDLWGQGRGNEIQHWIDSNPGRVRSLAILDDDSDMGHLLPRLVKTSNRIGLRPADVERVRGLLAVPV